MDKYHKAIIRYEAARKNVSVLALKRSDLINKCENACVEVSDGWFENFDFSKICLKVAYKQVNTIEAQYYSDGSYEDELEHMHEEGLCCDPCYQSYTIKIGDLAEAKQEFGNAKRSLSGLGKKLIKSTLNEE